VFTVAVPSLVSPKDRIITVYSDVKLSRRYEYLVSTVLRQLALDGLGLNALNAINCYLITTY